MKLFIYAFVVLNLFLWTNGTNKVNNDANNLQDLVSENNDPKIDITKLEQPHVTKKGESEKKKNQNTPDKIVELGVKTVNVNEISVDMKNESSVNMKAAPKEKFENRTTEPITYRETEIPPNKQPIVNMIQDTFMKPEFREGVAPRWYQNLKKEKTEEKKEFKDCLHNALEKLFLEDYSEKQVLQPLKGKCPDLENYSDDAAKELIKYYFQPLRFYNALPEEEQKEKARIEAIPDRLFPVFTTYEYKEQTKKQFNDILYPMKQDDIYYLYLMAKGHANIFIDEAVEESTELNTEMYCKVKYDIVEPEMFERNRFKSLPSDTEEKKAKNESDLKKAEEAYRESVSLYDLKLKACDFVRKADYVLLEKVFRKHMEIIMQWVSKKQGVALSDHVKGVELNPDTGRHEVVIPSMNKDTFDELAYLDSIWAEKDGVHVAYVLNAASYLNISTLCSMMGAKIACSIRDTISLPDQTLFKDLASRKLDWRDFIDTTGN